jgi:quercetin dioxygenase-like cupin family protein
MYGDFAPGLVHFTDDVLFMQFTPVTATAKAPEDKFSGDVYVTPIKQAEAPSRLIAALVRFAPGARTNSHSHAVGQTLHVTEGIGLVVGRDGTVIRMRAGDTVWTPPARSTGTAAPTPTPCATSPCSKEPTAETAPPGLRPSLMSSTRPPNAASRTDPKPQAADPGNAQTSAQPV